MTGPQDPAAAGRDRLRAGHADREQVIGTLKDAFVHGRLTRDELDAPAGRALSARTYADLAALTADIPAADIPAADIPAVPAVAATARPPSPVRRRPLARAAAGSGACLIIAAAAVRVGTIVDPGARPTPYDSWAAPMVLLAFLAVVAALGILGYGVAASWELRRSRGQRPPGPGPGGHDVDGERRGGTGRDPVLPALRTDQTRTDQTRTDQTRTDQTRTDQTRTDQTRTDLRVHKSRPRRRHIPARADRAPRGVRPAPGTA